ncbi:MAG TPA: hypothetical protein PKD70_00115 [Saprospiraceae bacterium]|nr:hypothetical protein [Saprospiraceae bacterium]HMP12248.1 hypothetical protein [Saprospiraceae bacterium]
MQIFSIFFDVHTVFSAKNERSRRFSTCFSVDLVVILQTQAKKQVQAQALGNEEKCQSG